MASQAELVALLPTTPYLLIYSLPLLLFSLVFTFTGTFLTLDRTRTFPARGTGAAYTSLPIPGSSNTLKERKISWNFEGGIGGLIGGYLFGVHLSTALSLLIPATTASATLSYKSFLAVWVLSVIPTTALAARYRYIAYAFYGASGGTLTSLAVCVIIHPSLPPRVILTITFLVLFFVLSLIFATIPHLNNRILHTFLRICTASTGAFGLILSIALLLNPRELSWANVWERLWVKDGINWGTTRERGLSAAYWIFFLLGIAVDWALHKWIGECPDEKWDDYLAHYASNLPNQPGRAGTFQPFNTFWDKWFRPNESKTLFDLSLPNDQRDPKVIHSPSDVDFKAHLALPYAMGDVGVLKPPKREMLPDREAEPLFPLSGGLRKKPGKKRKRGLGKPDLATTRGRKPVKFGSDLSSESESFDDDDETTKKGSQGSKTDSASSTPMLLQQERTLVDPPPQPTLPQARRLSSSATTLVERRKTTRPVAFPLALDYDREIEAVKDKLRRSGAGGVDGEVEYSDYEEDASSTRDRSGNSFTADGERWSPAFLARHQSTSTPKPPLGPPTAQIPGAMPVPATPSLIKALDRIAVAQKDAFGITGGVAVTDQRSQPISRLTEETEPDVGMATNRMEAPRWEEFWREVRVKAYS